MKNIVLVIFGLLIVNCSSAKLSNSWTSTNFDKTKKQKLLIIARSNDFDVRKSYEDELVLKLKELDVNAVAAYELCPYLKEKVNRSQEELNSLIQDFRNNGIEGILLTNLKNTKTESIDPTVKSNDNSLSQKGKYGISFTDYYNINSIEYLNSNLKPINQKKEFDYNTTAFDSTTYTLEVILYNLSLKDVDQLVGLYEVEVIDPKSAN